MLESALLIVFLFVPSLTLLYAKPPLWPLLFCLSLIPPFAVMLIFFLKVMATLHGMMS